MVRVIIDTKYLFSRVWSYKVLSSINFNDLLDVLLLDGYYGYDAEQMVQIIQEYLADTLTSEYVAKNNETIELAVRLFSDELREYLRQILRSDLERATLVATKDDTAIFEIAGLRHNSTNQTPKRNQRNFRI